MERRRRRRRRGRRRDRREEREGTARIEGLEWRKRSALSIAWMEQDGREERDKEREMKSACDNGHIVH